MSTIDRRNLLPGLFPDTQKYLMVTGLAGTSKDTAALTEDADYLFTMAGAMGASVSIGLGMALSAPTQEVAVITGDGELIMNIGSLITVASSKPTNLSIICVDNGMHGETGNQLGHTSGNTNLELIAKGAGFESILTIVTSEDIPKGAEFLTKTAGPRFIWARVKAGPACNYKRNLNLADCRRRFRKAYLSC
ncbi:MAG: thiamine pyrophosphate-dependent enzyme [Pseudomonadota bacterium]|nr:thiamine pyrophosphate-dependent enzyme [Pseudomonadota bacterium]